MVTQHWNWQAPSFAPNILLPLQGAVPLLSTCRQFVCGSCYFHEEKEAEKGLMGINFVALANSCLGGKEEILPWSSLPKYSSFHSKRGWTFCSCCLLPRGSPVPPVLESLQPQRLCPLPATDNQCSQHHTGLAPAEVQQPRTTRIYMSNSRTRRGVLGQWFLLSGQPWRSVTAGHTDWDLLRTSM